MPRRGPGQERRWHRCAELPVDLSAAYGKWAVRPIYTASPGRQVVRVGTDAPMDDGAALVVALGDDSLIRLCAWCDRHAVGGRWSASGDEARLLRLPRLAQADPHDLRLLLRGSPGARPEPLIPRTRGPHYSSPPRPPAGRPRAARRIPRRQDIYERRPALSVVRRRPGRRAQARGLRRRRLRGGRLLDRGGTTPRARPSL